MAPPRIMVVGMRFIDHLITRAWLVEIVCAFIEERGLDLAGRRVRIVVKNDLPDDIDHPEEGMVILTISRSGDEVENEDPERITFGNYRHFRRSDRIVLRVGRSTTTRGLLYTLYHELDHLVWQRERGGFDRSLPYRDRPHEIRARDNSKRSVHRLLGPPTIRPLGYGRVESGRERVRPITRVTVAPWVLDPDWASHLEVRS